MATDAEVIAAGFRLPKGTDLISQGDDAIRANAHAAFAGALWKGDLGSTSNLGGLQTGLYRVTNSTIATDLGLPAARPGILETSNILETGARAQRFQALGLNGGTTRVFYRDQISSTWSPWQEVQLGLTYQGVLPKDSDLNDVRTDGIYGAAAGITANRPVPLNGIVEVMSVGVGVMQRYTTVNAVPEVWMRRGQSDGSRWYAWVRIDAGGIELDDGGGGAPAHDLIRQGIQARKGGRIGTAGRGVIALRFDDAPAEFVAKVLPLLEARGLPFTRVTTSESVNGVDLPAGTFDTMQEYSIRAGGEVWNHGRTHGEASGAELTPEISGALDTLRAAMPRLPIDCFAPPGGSISWGGYMPSNSVENYTTTIAGQMIMRLHGLVTGYYLDSYYWPIDGIMRDGQNHYSCDTYTVARATELIDRARDWKVGVVMMWHGHNLDTSGNMSTADLETVLDYLAAERDAGNVLALTVSGMAVADKSTDFRNDILSTHSGSDWSESLTYPQFRREIVGSTRELSATVTGTAGTTVTSKVGESTRTHTIPAGGSLDLRHPATIPTDSTSLVVSITGGTTSNSQLLAV